MEVAFLVIVYMNCVTGVLTDRILTYVKAEVKRGLCSRPNYSILNTYSILKCALECSNTDECTKYMFCERYKTCHLLTELEECMSVYDDSCKCRAKRSIQDDGGSLVCHEGYYGENCKHIVEDCYHAHSLHTDVNQSTALQPESFFIQPNPSAPPFQIFCIINTAEYTLIMLRLRIPCQTRFFTTWQKYKDGFGNFHEGLWLGLDKIYSLTSMSNRRFKLIIKLYGDKYSCEAQIADFKIGNESSGYTLSLGDTLLISAGQCSDVFQNGLLSANNRPFSTFDKSSNNHNCPLVKLAGWWFADHPNCTAANLNGPLNAPYPLYFSDSNFENTTIIGVEMGIASM